MTYYDPYASYGPSQKSTLHPKQLEEGQFYEQNYPQQYVNDVSYSQPQFQNQPHYQYVPTDSGYLADEPQNRLGQASALSNRRSETNFDWTHLSVDGLGHSLHNNHRPLQNKHKRTHSQPIFSTAHHTIPRKSVPSISSSATISATRQQSTPVKSAGTKLSKSRSAINIIREFASLPQEFEQSMADNEIMFHKQHYSIQNSVPSLTDDSGYDARSDTSHSGTTPFNAVTENNNNYNNNSRKRLSQPEFYDSGNSPLSNLFMESSDYAVQGSQNYKTSQMNMPEMRYGENSLLFGQSFNDLADCVNTQSSNMLNGEEQYTNHLEGYNKFNPEESTNGSYSPAYFSPAFVLALESAIPQHPTFSHNVETADNSANDSTDWLDDLNPPRIPDSNENSPYLLPGLNNSASRSFPASPFSPASSVDLQQPKQKWEISAQPSLMHSSMDGVSHMNTDKTDFMNPSDINSSSHVHFEGMNNGILHKNSLKSQEPVLIQKNTDVQLIVNQYLSLSNPLLQGERRIQIWTPRVVQKSYGSEKRFFSPGPTLRLMGSSWFSNNRRSKEKTPDGFISISALQPSAEKKPEKDASSVDFCELQDTLLKFNVMIGENAIMHNVSESRALGSWYTITGNKVCHSSSKDCMPIWGRVTFRNLYLQDKKSEGAQVQKRDEKRVVTAHFVIESPDASSNYQTFTSCGPFSSVDLSVISKPSNKKGLPKDANMNIFHGSTIALYNRLRSQTGNTRYLGISSVDDMITTTLMAGTKEAQNREASEPIFSARQTSWDPFVIWVVNESGQMEKPQASRSPDGTINGPSIAMEPRSIEDAKEAQIPIYYNQSIVLQCATTGCVSPVLVVRKVETGVTAEGRATADSNFLSDPMAGLMPSDKPISSLQKLCLQLRDDKFSTPAGESYRPRFLACLTEKIEWHEAASERVWLETYSLSSMESQRQLSGAHHGSTGYKRSSVPKMYRQSPTSNWSRSQTDLQQNFIRNDSLPPNVGQSSQYDFIDGKPYQGVKFPNSKADRNSPCEQNFRPDMSRQYSWENMNSQNFGNSNSRQFESQPSSFSVTPQSSNQSISEQYEKSNDTLVATWTEELEEGCVWTILAAGLESYSVWAPPHIHNPILDNIPRIQNVCRVGIDGIEVKGTGLSMELAMYIGPYIIYQESLHLSDQKSQSIVYRVTVDIPTGNNKSYPILLVNCSGLVFNTDRKWPEL